MHADHSSWGKHNITAMLKVHKGKLSSRGARGRGARTVSSIEKAIRRRCSPDIVEALQKNSFCLVRMKQDRFEKAMDIAEERRFALSPLTKSFMMSEKSLHRVDHGGGGVEEEGYVIASPHKEMYHFREDSGACQTPSYWHIPTAPGACFNKMRVLSNGIFDGINDYVLNHLREEPYSQEAFPNDSEYDAWIDACYSSKQHILSSLYYHESNEEEFHAKSHIDRGLLTIITNPKDVEVLVGGSGGSSNNWVSLGEGLEPTSGAGGVAAVLCGYTLERATGGIFRAAIHRVRNTGERRSRVFRARLDPSVFLSSSSITACVSNAIKDQMLSSDVMPTEMSVGDLMKETTHNIHSSVNAPLAIMSCDGIANWLDLTTKSSVTVPADIIMPPLDESAGLLSTIPTKVAYQVFDWLRDLRDLANLAQTCRSLRAAAGSEVLCLPAAEASHVDWGAALDRLDRAAPSLARAEEDSNENVYNTNEPTTNVYLELLPMRLQGMVHWLLGHHQGNNVSITRNAETREETPERMEAPVLLASVSSRSRWLPMLIAEATDKNLREKECIRIRFRNAFTNKVWICKVGLAQKLKIPMAMCAKRQQLQSRGSATPDFFIGGHGFPLRYVNDEDTCVTLQLSMDATIYF